jgi:aquaporin rerated protein, other eukaryote
MFLFIAFAGTHIANLPPANPEITTGDGTTAPFVDTSNLFFIACSFGFGLAINAWIFFRVSGSVFNPAITLSLFLIGALSPLRSAIYLVAQLLGGISAAALVDVLLPGGINFDTTLAGGVNISQGLHSPLNFTDLCGSGLFLEMFMTAQLVFVVLMLGVEKQRSTYLAPLAVGLTLFMCELASVYYTGGSLNPARSFGPNVVMRSFPSYHWIYCTPLSLGEVSNSRGRSLPWVSPCYRPVRLFESGGLRKCQWYRRSR